MYYPSFFCKSVSVFKGCTYKLSLLEIILYVHLQKGLKLWHNFMNSYRQTSLKVCCLYVYPALNSSYQSKIALELKKNPLSAVLEDLSPDRQSLIETPTLSDTEFVKRWLSVEYEKKSFPQDGPEYFTATGKRVRSKSEIIIADTLDRLNIPYRYEFPVKVGEVLLHPDFFCLNTITRQEFAWEHLGMMDDCDYSVKAVQKLHLYQKKKWLPGKNMIITMETRESPINSKQVEEVARAYCLIPLFPNRG